LLDISEKRAKRDLKNISGSFLMAYHWFDEFLFIAILFSENCLLGVVL